jgi:hypothetical protein
MAVNRERLHILARIHRRMGIGWDSATFRYPDYGGGRRKVSVEVLDEWERDFENFVSVTE